MIASVGWPSDEIVRCGDVEACNWSLGKMRLPTTAWPYGDCGLDSDLLIEAYGSLGSISSLVVARLKPAAIVFVFR
jgi:hypothetical protein